MKSDISCLQFRTYVGALYNELFLNKKVKITRDNIGKIENRIKYLLSYFIDWYRCREKREKSKDSYGGKLWSSSVLSPITYYNMRLGVIGFLEYSKYVLCNYPDVSAILILHSNQSSLEAHFSLMRYHGAYTPSNYERTFNIVDNEKSTKMMEGNKMYEGHEEKYANNGLNTRSRNDKKKSTVRDNEKINERDSLINAFDVWTNEENIQKLKGIWDDIKEALIFGSYKKHLLEHTPFRSYCVATMGTTNEKTILYFLNTTDVEVEKK